MSALKDLQIEETNIDMYTTPYVNVSNYKYLRIISSFSNAGYLYIYHSIDSKTDSLTNTYLCNNKASLHKIEVISDFIRICITTMNPNEIIDKVSISVKGRRAVSSNLFNLLERFQPSQETTEEKKEITLLEPVKQEKPEKINLYQRLGIHPKPKATSDCKCKVPELLLKGHLLYCKEMGCLEVLPPPVSDDKNYVLVICNKQPYWILNSELQGGQGWFKQ